MRGSNQSKRWESLLEPALPVIAMKARFTALTVPPTFSSFEVSSGVLGGRRANSSTETVFLQSSLETGGGIALLVEWKKVERFEDAEDA